MDQIPEDYKQTIERTLYTTTKPDAKSHRGVVVFDKKFAVSNLRGVHSLLKKGDKVVLYNVVDPTLEIEVVVTHLLDVYDCICFETVTGEFPHYPCGDDNIHVGTRYLQLEVGPKREPVWKEGVVTGLIAGHYLGTPHGEHGNFGCGLFDRWGYFFGFSVAITRRDFSNLKITEGVDPPRDTEIVSSMDLFAYVEPLNADLDSDYE